MTPGLHRRRCAHLALAAAVLAGCCLEGVPALRGGYAAVPGAGGDVQIRAARPAPSDASSAAATAADITGAASGVGENLHHVDHPARGGEHFAAHAGVKFAVRAPRAFDGAELATNHTDAEYRFQEPAPAASVWEFVHDVVGGTGASLGCGNRTLDQLLIRRMQTQDKAVMVLLMFAYVGSLFFSACLAYHQAYNHSQVKYYADPRRQDLMFDGHDFEGFLETFNQAPQECHLHVTGYLPLPPLQEEFLESVAHFNGKKHLVVFSFSLDLSPWVVRDGAPASDPPSLAGVMPEDMEALNNWLPNNHNDLAFVQMEKHVTWQNWEELATNIKSKIRQAGFTGVVTVIHSGKEVFTVHKNRRWANFMHSQTTKVLAALSLFGCFVYSPYMWLRQSSIMVRCKYRVDMPIERYWLLIGDKLGAEGFDPAPPPP